MEDNSDDETLKRKKIRRILLLKTDEELKTISKKKCTVMINSKTMQEMNKSYNIYNILLSEKSRVYSNYVITEEKIVPNNIFNHNIIPIHSVKAIIQNKKVEKPIKLLNSTFEEDSFSPIISIFPKKIDLGFKRFKMNKKSLNEMSLQKYIDENINLEKGTSNEEKLFQSTKIEKRGIFKLVDKILTIKMNDKAEDIIKKNIIILRKYCDKLKKRKKKNKKIYKQKMKSYHKKRKEKKYKNVKSDKNYKEDQRESHRKRNTTTNDKSFFKKSLFGSRDARVDSRLTTAKQLNLNIIEMDDYELSKRAKEKNRDKSRKISSTKVLKQIISIKKEKILRPSSKKKTYRRMQTLKEKKENKEKILSDLRSMKSSRFNKNSEINKNDDSGPSLNQISKGHLMSSKFQRPSKFQFCNTTNSNNNQNNIKREGSKTKNNSLFKRFSSFKEKKGNIQSCFNNKDKEKDKERDKDKEKTRVSMTKPKKNISNRKEEKNVFEQRLSNKDEVIKSNILSEFNKKPKKKLFESPVKKNDYYPNMNKKLKLNF